MTEAEYLKSLEKMSFAQLETHIESLFRKIGLAQIHRDARDEYGRESYGTRKSTEPQVAAIDQPNTTPDVAPGDSWTIPGAIGSTTVHITSANSTGALVSTPITVVVTAALRAYLRRARISLVPYAVHSQAAVLPTRMRPPGSIR